VTDTHAMVTADSRTRGMRGTRIRGGRPGFWVYAGLAVVFVSAAFPLWWSFIIGSGDASSLRTRPWWPGGNFIENAIEVMNNPAVNFWPALWNSIYVATLSTIIALIAAILIWLIGFVAFLVIHLSIVILAGSIGIWLFYVQHQFEETAWSRSPEWEFQYAALHGSSYYDLPMILRWFTGNIGIHHVHHLSAKVPHYRLPEVLRDYPELRNIGRITLLDSLRCVKLALWDESRSKLVSFREARMMA